jgi:anhydro-N-acetylmuramic acid kinase
MIAMLRKKLQVSLHSTADWGINPEWIEAAGFAYLAKQRMENKRSYLGQTTGSKSKVMLGAIYEPPLPT